MDINEILNDFNDINFYYNDCTKLDLLRRDLECYHSDRIKELEEELERANTYLRAIEDIAREILNRPNTENTRVNLKRALTDILDISKSGEEVLDNEN